MSSYLSTVINFVDFASSHKEVSSENASFINLIQRVRQDEGEARRLHGSQVIIDHYESWPDRKSWNEQVLSDVHCALNDIGVYIEDGRNSGDKSGAVGALKQRFEWVLRHHQKLLSRQTTLAVCHQSLMSVISTLQVVEMSSVYGQQTQTFEAPATPWIRRDEKDILRSPYSRHKWRHSQRNLSLPSISLPSITVSEHEDKASIYSTESVPAELPGSTPDDLVDADNWDLYNSPPSSRPRVVEEESFEPSPLSTPATEETEIHYSQNRRMSLDHPPSGRRLRSSSDIAPSPLRHWSSSDQIVTTSSLKSSSDRVHDPAASFDQIVARSVSRGPASNDENSARTEQPKNSPESPVRSRASLDNVSSLPTVQEKPSELYESSNQDENPHQEIEVGNMPVLAKRYRPTPVIVRKPVAKHRSLPSQLPYLPHQPSLISELSHWVTPSTSTDQTASTGEANPIFDVAPKFISSSVPNTPASCPPGIRYTSRVVVDAKQVSASAPSSPPTQQLPSPTISTDIKNNESITENIRQPKVGVTKVDSGFVEGFSMTEMETTLHEEKAQSSATTPRPGQSMKPNELSSPDIIVDDRSAITSSLNFVPPRKAFSTTSLQSKSSLPQPRFSSSEKEVVPSTLSAESSPASPIISQETVDPKPSAIHSVVPSASSSNTNLASPVISLEVVKPTPATAHPAVTSLSSTDTTPTSPVISLEPVILSPADIPPKQPMTSQEKRRRAHAHRMQIAYGS